VISRLRLMLAVARPAVVLLLAVFTAIGLAQAGRGGDPLLLGRALFVVVGFLMFSVACNDLADEAVDRVNLSGDRRRPLVAGTAGRRDLVVLAVTGAVLALVAAATLHPAAVAVILPGLIVSAAYSLPPLRISGRGVLASLVLPACYVAVPYLVGVIAGRGTVRAGDLSLLTGLYVAFIGRILLKDFRDVHGDAFFGKRTFLVRYGRRWTCRVSASCWAAGTVTLLATVPHPTPVLCAGYAVCLAIALGLLRALAAGPPVRQEEAIISATAIVGRGMTLTLLVHLTMTSAWGPLLIFRETLLGLLFTLTAGQAALMLVRGPVTRLTVPHAWTRERSTAITATSSASGPPVWARRSSCSRRTRSAGSFQAQADRRSARG
jgi:4-hydroxybenzoate polyprenyltransferase